MGMSASQARLLSITSRLTDNELHAQLISNSKLRLATESNQASNEYMNALNSKNLMYVTYDDNGEKTTTPFTAATIYNYAPLKNQYMLVNAADKVLVTHQDAINFEQTNDLVDFLKRYDLVYNATEDVEEINKNKMADWQKKCDELRAEYKVKHDEWKVKHDQWKIDHANWEAHPYEYSEDNSLYEDFISAVGDSRILNKYAGAPWNAGYCYYEGLNGDPECYLHMLNFFLLFTTKELPTSLENKNVKPNGESGGTFTHATDDEKETLRSIGRKIIADENLLCDGADKFTPYYNNDGVNDKLEGNLIQQAIDAGRRPTDLEILMSDYKYDATTNKCSGIKSLKQKIIDLYYIIQNGLVSDQPTMKALLINLTEGDLKMVSQKQLPEPEEPVEPELVLPDPPEEESGYILLKDKDKAQWYTNLWYKMNKSVSSNLVEQVDFENNIKWNDIPENIRREYQFEVSNKVKNKDTINYVELESNLSTSESWLQFALEHGIVTLEQAKFYDPAEDGGKVPEATADGYIWSSIPYKNATDIISVENDKKIAVAQVKYEKTMNDIQIKDKKYDADLKKLDTQHNALQTEYDSVKEMISKNVNRSFKAFS